MFVCYFCFYFIQIFSTSFLSYFPFRYLSRFNCGFLLFVFAFLMFQYNFVSWACDDKHGYLYTFSFIRILSCIDISILANLFLSDDIIFIRSFFFTAKFRYIIFLQMFVSIKFYLYSNLVVGIQPGFFECIVFNRISLNRT